MRRIRLESHRIHSWKRMIYAIICFMSVLKYLDNLEDLSGKKVLIAGGTAGIGLSIVKQLLYKHADVIVLARNEDKFNKVKSDLLTSYPQGSIGFIKYDQNDNQSILKATQKIVSHHLDFYALILNAGLIQGKKNFTITDGYPTAIKTNYVGLAVLLKGFVPLLKESQRIIIQGSLGAGLCFGKIRTLKEQKPRMFRQYFISKAGVEALFYYYNKQESVAPGFYLVEPGITNSDIIRDFPRFIRFLGKIVLRLFSHSPDKAALTAMKALQSDMEKGTYIVPRGFCTYCGYPKIKSFPKSRRREYLVDMINQK